MQRSLPVKLEIAEKILRVAVIAFTLYGNAYFYGLLVGNIFRYWHYIYLERKIVLYFEVVIFATRYQSNRSCEDCQEYVYLV